MPSAMSTSSAAIMAGANARTARAQIAVLVDTPTGPVRAYAPVVGRISMDQIAVDLTCLKAARGVLSDYVRIGTPVELITPDREAPNHLVRLAEAAGTLPHEILCGLNPRIRRAYGQPLATVETFVNESAPAVAS